MKSNLKYFILIFIISMCIGFLLAKIMQDNNKNIASESGISENYIVSENIILQNTINTINSNILETSFDEDKIEIDTKLILRKNYLDCNHIISKEVELPKELVNLTEEELKEKYIEWNIEEFDDDKVILYKNIYGLCDEHFIIESGEEFIEVYSLTEEYDKELYQTTNISIEYLAEEDLEKLKDGIYVYGSQELNSTLENFE